MGKRLPVIDVFEIDLLAFWRSTGLDKKAFCDKHHFTNHLFLNLQNGGRVSIKTIEKGYRIFHESGFETVGQYCDVLFLSALLGEDDGTLESARALKACYEGRNAT